MNRKIIYIILSSIILTLGMTEALLHQKVSRELSSATKESIQLLFMQNAGKQVEAIHPSMVLKASRTLIPELPEVRLGAATKLKKAAIKKLHKTQIISKKHPARKIIIKNNSIRNLALTEVSFDELPGWDTADVKKSLVAFQVSCKKFLKQSPSHPTGSNHIRLKAGDWHPACKAASKLGEVSEESAKEFFEKWFHPIEFKQKKQVQGLFTGYYMPQVEGSLKKTSTYNTPIYGLPKGSANYTREQIDKGAIKRKAPVIAWIHSPAERLFLEIEGSGVIKLSNGKRMYLGYAGENGSPYTSIGQILINKGLLTRHNASKLAIMRYLENHSEKARTLLSKNKSFVYFEDLKKPLALGTQDIALTPGYSLAVDKKWIPIGAPLWLDTKKPAKKHNDKSLQRLMIAQDTGGAIRGFMRGDIYWGSGKIAAFLGEHMKTKGHYWLLLPKHIINRLSKSSL